MLLPNGRKQIPSRPGRGGDLQSEAASDLGADAVAKTQAELDEIKRRKKLLGAGPAMSPAVMSLTGNQY